MLEKFKLFDSDKEIGTLQRSSEGGHIELEVRLIDGLERIEVPYDLHILYASGHRVFKGEVVWEWIIDRVIPSRRQDIHEILESLNIPEYDEWELFKAYSGKCVRDTWRIEPIL
jgi:hypothetical protein